MERKQINNDKLVGEGEVILSRKTEELQEIEIGNAVFNNPLLMDQIVKYSIYNSNGKQIDKQTIVSLRLVNKGFLQSASRILAKSGESTINLAVVCSSGICFKRDKTLNVETEAVLDRFVSVFAKTSRSIDSILPISFDVLSGYLMKENSETLTNFLEQCSDIISKLCVNYPIEEGSMNVICISTTFPILRDLEFHFEALPDTVRFGSKDPVAKGMKLLRQVLQNSPNLQRFTLIDLNKNVVNVGAIILPATITSLRLNSLITENELSLLTKTRLLNLNALNLEIQEQSEMDLIYKILEHFQHQLTTLEMKNYVQIFFDDDEDQDELPICVKLPLMEKLKSLKLSGSNYSLFPEMRYVWPKLIPNVTALVLQKLSSALFLEWVQGCRFENVKKFKFSLSPGNDITKTLSPNVQIMNEVITSFPKLEKLSITFKLNETSGLIYLFQNFTHLKKLKLNFKRGCPDSYPGCQFVSILLGIPLRQAAALFFKAVPDVNVAVDNPQSIMNLTELNSLTLKTQWCNFPEGSKEHLFFEIISNYGLNKMPKLQKIKRLGGFEMNGNDDD